MTMQIAPNFATRCTIPIWMPSWASKKCSSRLRSRRFRERSRLPIQLVDQSNWVRKFKVRIKLSNFPFRASLLCGCCANGAPCDITTGQCPGGCAPGYSGADCTEPTCNGKIGRSPVFSRKNVWKLLSCLPPWPDALFTHYFLANRYTSGFLRYSKIASYCSFPL